MAERAIAARPGVRVRGRRRRRASRGSRRRVTLGAWLSVWSRRACVALALAAALAAGYLLWFRDSSLVEVRDVRVSGLSGPEEAEIASALEGSALQMTTLHVRLDELVSAVREYPSVESLKVSPDFPHALEIAVTERRPVARVNVGSGEVAVADDGTLLPAVVTDDLHLPTLEADPPESAARLDGSGIEQAAVLGAAPEPLRPLVEGIAATSEGIEVRLEGGISLRFGDPSRAVAKWAAAARILADPGIGSLTYIDLRSPTRPAVGGAVPASEAEPVAPPG
jgi:cell division protein FtsQ